MVTSTVTMVTLSGTFDNGSECTECPAGQIAKEAGQVRCTDCAPGHYSTPGQPVCVPCERGLYQPDEGASYCTPCPVGMFSRYEGK